MKKLLATLLVLVLVCALFAGCEKRNKKNSTTPTPTLTPTAAPTDVPTPTPDTTPEFDPNAKSEGVMTYAQYAAAEKDDEVTIECFVQNHQSWWDDKITVYAADGDGAYFLYNMACSEEDSKKLVPGTKIKVKGYKAEWSGEVEVDEGATFEFVESESWIAPVVDVTALLGTDDLVKKQNQFVSFKGMTVSKAALYKLDGSGSQGDDLYFDVALDGKVYTFTVESYLCGKDTDVYKAVEALKVGDIVDLEGFLYWYNGVNPHITSCKVLGNVNAKSEGVMTYEQYAAAAKDDEVTIECYVQNHQSWWEDKVTVYAADGDGAYFLYNMACTEEDSKKLVPGTKIKVKGYKTEWSGEVEVDEGATFEFEEGSYIAPAVDVTALLGTDDLIKKQNQYVSFKGMTVSKAALYKWDGSGSQGDDLYFDVTLDGKNYTFTVESYLCGKDTDVYKAVEALKVGDKIDMEGFLYWYNGVNPHITKVSAAQ